MLTKYGKIIFTAMLFVGASQAGFTQEKAKVAFVPQIVGIPYFNAMEAGGHRAAQDLGVEFIYIGPVDTNPVDQLQIVQNLIDQGVDAVSVSVLDASSIAPVVEMARAKGVKLFTSDSDAPASGRAVYVGSATDESLGFTIIDELVKRVGDKAKIGIVSGEATASNLNVWIEFMKKRASERYPDLQLLEPQFAGGTVQRAAQIAGDLLTANPDLKAIIAVSSTSCPGVAQAIETAGKIGSVIGTGYCSPNTARSYLKSGAFAFTVLWDPEKLGYLTVWAGKKLIDDEPFALENALPAFDGSVVYDEQNGLLILGAPAVFTTDNVDDFDF